jgi:uncharacterized membrane protein
MMFLPVHPMWFPGLLVILVVILLVVWAVQASVSRGPSSTGGPAGGPPGVMPPAAGREAPIDILKRRLAAGEITPEDFERMRKLLE